MALKLAASLGMNEFSIDGDVPVADARAMYEAWLKAASPRQDLTDEELAAMASRLKVSRERLAAVIARVGQ
jgi:hypothetical protein